MPTMCGLTSSPRAVLERCSVLRRRARIDSYAPKPRTARQCRRSAAGAMDGTAALQGFADRLALTSVRLP
jgi:hypothetical protein